jgi:hypothetical protein
MQAISPQHELGIIVGHLALLLVPAMGGWWWWWWVIPCLSSRHRGGLLANRDET